MTYYHLDVFSSIPYSGNGLTVFLDTENLDKKKMQTITQEMRQFESIFLQKINDNVFRAYIFTVDEELDFAGHPIIGAAALLHDLYSNQAETFTWIFELNKQTIEVRTKKNENYFSAEMNQGKANFLATLTCQQEIEFLEYLSLTDSDKIINLPLQVISTGLPYLIVPVKTESLKNVRIRISDLEEKLSLLAAKFLYVYDTLTKEGRTWDNLGLVEDIATGSAAGPLGAYLIYHNLAKSEDEIEIKQGSFLGRPSEIFIRTDIKGNVFVRGDVCKVAKGQLLV